MRTAFEIRLLAILLLAMAATLLHGCAHEQPGDGMKMIEREDISY